MSVRTNTITAAAGWTVGTLGVKGGDMDGEKRKADIDYLKTAFDSFDVDKSGFIDPQELCAALTMLGIRGKVTLDDVGVEDRDRDGVISLADLDKNGDEKIDFEEFKVLAAVLPKRDHPIYRNALLAKKVELPRDVSRATPVQRNQAAAQKATEDALNKALRRLCKGLKITTNKKLSDDAFLLKAFQRLDTSGDARVNIKEIENLLKSVASDGENTMELTKQDAWLLMNCADVNNDKMMTFDEFKRMLQTVLQSVKTDDEA